ncbi:Clp protease N-terminal domain-containing protein [Streptomyces sp. NPDC058964]|uniref:Clp protease N-terminal domain-containing protein n=1 Tax=Streptomyces sp. NPDC058964 TaxID=3346681 RepID=UPI0036926989
MQPRIPRQSAHDRGVRRPDDVAGLGAEPAAVVAGARRRAVRDGDRQIDTAHLLHSLLESDPEVRAVIGEAPQVARLLGYLVQRSIGYGLRWRSAVEDSGAVPVLTSGPRPGGAGPTGIEPRDAAGWSPLAAAAVEHARECAARRGDAQARGIDLLAGIVVDPQARAVEVLGRARVEVRDLRERIERRAGEYAGGGGTPR